MVRSLWIGNLWVLFFSFTSSFAFGQFKTSYPVGGYIRDLIHLDSTIFTIHYIPDTTVINVTGKIAFYKFNSQLNLTDSLILDSLAMVKCLPQNNQLFLIGTKNYPDTFTRSIVAYKLNASLDIIDKKEFKEPFVSINTSNFIISNDSLKLLAIVDRYQGMGTRYVYEFTIDSLLNVLDSTSCKIVLNDYLQYYYQNVVKCGNNKFYSGNLTNFLPRFYKFNTIGDNCSFVEPYNNWYNYIEQNSNFLLTPRFTNYLLYKDSSFYISSSGEQDFGSFNSVAFVLKTDTNFNINSFFITDPGLNDDYAPFRNISTAISSGKLLFASNTKHDSWQASPYAANDLKIDLLDTTLNLISSVNLNPFNSTDSIYYGSIISAKNNEIVLSGSIYPTTPQAQLSTFIVKYDGISELLGIKEKNVINTSLKFYPNPVSEKIKIETDHYFNNADLNIYNSIGELVYHNSFSNNEIDISTLSNGLYILTITNKTVVYKGSFIKSE